MTEIRKVLPGEEVAVEEEYLAAEGTYNEDGLIYASQMGELHLDDEERVAKVLPANPLVKLVEGEIVYCEITDVRSAMAICDVVAVEGKKRAIAGDTYGTIHVSKISPYYTEDVGRELRPSDIVRAKVTQVKPSLQLTTVDAHLGVVKGLCKRCRQKMERDDKGLFCKDCERREPRKLADDYGNVVLP
jgi:exosome complex component CSL4